MLNVDFLTGITKICIDDFALKKRHRYGTVIINAENHKIIDMIESREQADVAVWLSKFPNIRVVSRDGSSQYATAIKQAHPNALQVSDRFHLIKNLTDYAKQHITKAVKTNFRIPVEECETNLDGGYWDKIEPNGADLPERTHVANTEKKRVMIGKARELAAQGLTITEIAKEVGISYLTAKKYICVEFDPANKYFGAKLPSKLKPYTEVIDQMLQKHFKFKEIETVIRADGYDGAASTIRMYATRQRKIIKETRDKSLANTKIIERRWLTKLLYKPIDKVKELTEDHVIKIIEEYPVVGTLYEIVQSFKKILSTKRVDELGDWIEYASQFDIDEINSFINGINSDLEAVKNAIRYEYNNGLAEGTINKIKVIKRIMYGRCSFNLLRNKILLQDSLY